MERTTLWLMVLLGCSSGDDAPADAPVPTADTGPVDPWSLADFPEPSDWTASGPGASARSFSQDEILVPCGNILGGPGDVEHHNLSVIYDGYLVHPWAPEDGGGGISFFDASDPCQPALVGQVWADKMRETHALAFGDGPDGRRYLAVDMHESSAVGGVGFFDVTDPADPRWVSELATPGYYYPDAYLRVTFGSFWQGDYLYVAAAFNGVHVIDVSDPLNPELATTWTFDGPHLVGNVVVVGNVAMAASAGLPRVVFLDVSDPLAPEPIPGGDIVTVSSDGSLETSYFNSWSGKYAFFARNTDGGGPIVYDVSDPGAPRWVAQAVSPEGDGGYVYRHGSVVVQGESEHGAIYDFVDETLTEVARVDVAGDLDTISPLGNVAVVSVDEKGDPGQASTVFPMATEPDTTAPVAELHFPVDAAVGEAVTSRIGVSFDEWVEWASVHRGSFRVVGPEGEVPGRFNVQEAVVNFSPVEPLQPGTTYQVWLPAGGIADISGNPMATELRFSFTTEGGETSTESSE